MYTTKQKLEAIERELTFRRRVYDRRVTLGYMSRQHADYQIDVFEAIREDYAKEEVGERLI